jgi:HPt (histidine-containing phosphotransfer) domain-containing protein
MTGPAIDAEAFARLLEITGGDPEFLAELVDTYLQDGAAQVEALRVAATSGDIEGVVRPAHTLKSSSASVGAMPLAELCRTLEADARSGHVPDLAARVAAVADAFTAASAALQAVEQG